MQKTVFLLLIAFSISISSFCQTWTAAQLDSANTAKSVTELSAVEKEAIMYINLARLYPQLFIKNEVENYTPPAKYGDYLKNSTYKTSLIADLKVKTPIKALVFDDNLYSYAKCFAKESGVNGLVGHERKNCPSTKGLFAECCSYGMDTGKDIAMQWLIDDKIQNLGHRINCLNGRYIKIGISTYPHKTYENCAVADFSW